MEEALASATWNVFLSAVRALGRRIGIVGVFVGGGVLSYVIDNLVRDAAVVLQDVVVLAADGAGDARGNGQDLGQLVVGDVVQLGAVVLGDDELFCGDFR